MKAKLKKRLSKMHEVKDTNSIFVYKFKTPPMRSNNIGKMVLLDIELMGYTKGDPFS